MRNFTFKVILLNFLFKSCIDKIKFEKKCVEVRKIYDYTYLVKEPIYLLLHTARLNTRATNARNFYKYMKLKTNLDFFVKISLKKPRNV